MGTIARPSSRPISYLTASDGVLGSELTFREAGPAGPPKPRLLDRVRQTVRARHYSRRTEKAYVDWIRRYIFFHDKRGQSRVG